MHSLYDANNNLLYICKIWWPSGVPLTKDVLYLWSKTIQQLNNYKLRFD